MIPTQIPRPLRFRRVVAKTVVRGRENYRSQIAIDLHVAIAVKAAAPSHGLEPTVPRTFTLTPLPDPVQ